MASNGFRYPPPTPNPPPPPPPPPAPKSLKKLTEDEIARQQISNMAMGVTLESLIQDPLIPVQHSSHRGSTGSFKRPAQFNHEVLSEQGWKVAQMYKKDSCEHCENKYERLEGPNLPSMPVIRNDGSRLDIPRTGNHVSAVTSTLAHITDPNEAISTLISVVEANPSEVAGILNIIQIGDSSIGNKLQCLLMNCSVANAAKFLCLVQRVDPNQAAGLLAAVARIDECRGSSLLNLMISLDHTKTKTTFKIMSQVAVGNFDPNRLVTLLQKNCNQNVQCDYHDDVNSSRLANSLVSGANSSPNMNSIVSVFKFPSPPPSRINSDNCHCGGHHRHQQVPNCPCQDCNKSKNHGQLNRALDNYTSRSGPNITSVTKRLDHPEYIPHIADTEAVKKRKQMIPSDIKQLQHYPPYYEVARSVPENDYLVDVFRRADKVATKTYLEGNMPIYYPKEDAPKQKLPNLPKPVAFIPSTRSTAPVPGLPITSSIPNSTAQRLAMANQSSKNKSASKKSSTTSLHAGLNHPSAPPVRYAGNQAPVTTQGGSIANSGSVSLSQAAAGANLGSSVIPPSTISSSGSALVASTILSGPVPVLTTTPLIPNSTAISQGLPRSSAIPPSTVSSSGSALVASTISSGPVPVITTTPLIPNSTAISQGLPTSSTTSTPIVPVSGSYPIPVGGPYGNYIYNVERNDLNQILYDSNTQYQSGTLYRMAPPLVQPQPPPRPPTYAQVLARGLTSSKK